MLALAFGILLALLCLLVFSQVVSWYFFVAVVTGDLVPLLPLVNHFHMSCKVTMIDSFATALPAAFHRPIAIGFRLVLMTFNLVQMALNLSLRAVACLNWPFGFKLLYPGCEARKVYPPLSGRKLC